MPGGGGQQQQQQKNVRVIPVKTVPVKQKSPPGGTFVEVNTGGRGASPFAANGQHQQQQQYNPDKRMRYQPPNEGRMGKMKKQTNRLTKNA
jgi:hypothetical protein